MKNTATFQLTLKLAEYEDLCRQMAELDRRKMALSREILELEQKTGRLLERAVEQAA